MTSTGSIIRRLALSVFVMILGACVSSRPNVKVLGVTDTATSSARQETLLVFVEVVNPTRRALTLSRLEYRLDAESWFQADGEVLLSRAIAPQSSAIIEVPIRLRRLEHGDGMDGVDGMDGMGELAGSRHALAERGADNPVTYSLEGRLFAVSEQVQRSWSVEVEGTLNPDAVADARRAPRLDLRIADGN